MIGFLNPLKVQWLHGRIWQTIAPLGFRDGKNLWVVPIGFVTDFASIPRLFWTLIGSPAGPYVAAAVLHDFFYRAQLIPKPEADRTFLTAMQSLGVGTVRRTIIYLAVKFFGWHAWHDNKRNRAKWLGTKHAAATRARTA